MVRFHNAVVSILSESNTIDESGDYIAEWEQTEVIEGDVQPHSLTEDEIKAQIEDMAEYVSSFHGLTNKHAVKYANLRTAGSTLKAMKPVKGDLPAKQKMANAAENTLRFLGLRIPKFTKIDENGKKVFDPKGLATLAVDALVVGGVAAAGILGGPWGLAGVGVAYAARGAVVLGNKGAAAIEYARFGDEIDKNLPTPYEATKDSREVARKEYYREVEGMGKFTSWVKAKADRLPFFRKRAKETGIKDIRDSKNGHDRCILRKFQRSV